MKMSKKLLSLLLCAVMVLGAVPLSGIISFAADSCEHTDADNDNICDSCMRELYVDRRLNAAGDAVVSTLAEIPTSYEELTSETSELEAGRWYFLDEDVKAAARIFANGTPDNPSYLILRDDCTIEADEGIGVGNGHELHIYAQSGDSGKIVAKGGVNNAGIGGSYSSDSCGTLVICGGIISATGGSEGAGIGGGPAGNSGNIMILGGTINACGDFRSAGIGAGLNSHGGTVSIYGGKITATGGDDGEGIGGYCFRNGSYHGTLKVYGGDVTASGGEYSAGIGHNVEIYGGKVKAVGSKYGAGIGGGYGGNGVRFLMHDGTVEAFGGQGGAGIGGGRGGSDESFEIHGGTVTATGGSYAAGIGGGGSYDKAGGFQGASGGNVKMYGGNVTAVGGYGGAGVGGGPTGQGRSVTVYGGTLTARGDYGSAGIGGGYSAPGGTFTIYDGTVIADGGNLSAGIGGGFRADGGSFRMIGGNIEAIGKNAPGIGGGDNAQDNGSFTVTAVAEIKSGSAKPGSETTVEQYITSRNSYVNISGFCGHVDSDGDRVCDFCEKGLYIDRTWDTDKKAVVDSFATIPDSAVIVNGDIDTLDSGKFYVIDGDIRIKHRVTVNGDVTLVLKDNSTLRIANGLVECGLTVNAGSSLSVYAQSDGETAGKLIAEGDLNSAGIGGGRYGSGGNIAIYGGNVTAVGGQFGAGIGGGQDGNGGNVDIYGGVIKASGGTGGAGIGSGFFADGGKVNIYGGTVITAGGYSGAGIGGGDEGNGGDVTFYAGSVIASCGVYCDIFGHGSAEDPHIWLENGTVSAGEGTTLYNSKNGTVIAPGYGAYHGALNDEKFYDLDGFGSVCFYADTEATAQNRVSYLEYDPETGKAENKSVSENSAFPVGVLNDWSVQWIKAEGNITIDGTVTVNGDVNLILEDNCTLTVNGRILVEAGNSLTIYAQSTGDSMGKLIAAEGIGGGSKTESGTVTIHGGDIRATGSANSAGIGGGYRGGAGTVIIYDGKVTAEGGDDAAGIGASLLGSGGNVEIYGGTVIVEGNGGSDGISADNISVYDAQVTSNGTPLESGHMHHMTKVEAKDATCTEAGNTTTYYVCTGDHSCGKSFSDPDAVNELTAEQVAGYVITALGHSFTSEKYSNNNNGTHSEKCIRCNKYGNAEPHELVNGKCTKCGFCEHLSSTWSFEWEYEYTRCEAIERCDICGSIIRIQFSFDISFVEDTVGKDCKTPGKGHYEAVFSNLGITGKTESIIDTATGPHSYKDYVCVICGDELLDDAKAAAKAAIDKAADGSSDSTVTTICRTAKSIIDAADSVEEVFEAQEEWLAVIEKQTFEPHEHTFSEEYSKNDYSHWHAATCEHTDIVKDAAAHTFDEGTTEGGKTTYTCTVCGYEKVESALTLGDIIGKVSGTYGGTIPAAEAAVTMTVSADEISTETIASDWARKSTVDADGATEWYTESFENGQPVYPAEPTGEDKEETIEKYLNTEIVITEETITVGDNIAVPAGSYVLSDIFIFFNEQNGEIQEIFLNGVSLKRINEAQHEHTFDTQYSKNEFVHWYAATCEHTDIVKGVEAHTFEESKTPEGELIYICSVCGFEKGEDKTAKALAEAQSALAEANKALEEKTAALDTAEEELGKAADELTKAQNALNDKTAALKTAEDNLDAANTALDEAKSQISTLTSELDNANKELSESKAALDEAKSQNEDLTADLDEANNELTETKTALDEANASLETAKSEKADLEAQLAEKETELDNLIKSSDAKDDEIAALKSDIAGLKSDIEAKDGEITEKANEIAGLEKSVSELEKAVETKDGEIAAKVNEIAGLEKDISELESAIETKNGEIAAKADEIAALESNVTALEKEISEANSEIAQKNEQIESLNGELEKAKAEIEELRKGEDTSCSYCGKEKHESFFDKVVCFFKRIGFFFKILFDFSMDKKN